MRLLAQETGRAVDRALVDPQILVDQTGDERARFNDNFKFITRQCTEMVLAGACNRIERISMALTDPSYSYLNLGNDLHVLMQAIEDDIRQVFPATAAGPSTPEDWQKMYAACVEGAQTLSNQQEFGQGGPAAFCGCVRDDLKNVAADDRDAQFPTIRDRCLQRALLATGDYPDAGIANLRAGCAKRKDILAQAITAYCDCYVALMQKTVPWRDLLLLDPVIKTKGVGGLDPEETTILGKGLEAGFYCSLKSPQ